MESKLGSKSTTISRKKFAELMAGISSSTNKKFTDAETEFWYTSFSDLPAEFVEQAFTCFVLAGDDWPTIAKIRKLAGSAMHGECLTFGEAFDRMLSAVRHYGRYDVPTARKSLDDLTWRTVQSLGGWEAVCETPTNQLSTLRAQFRMVYESLRDREERHRALPEAVRPRIENPKQLKIEASAKEPDSLVLNLNDSMKMPKERTSKPRRSKSKEQQLKEAKESPLWNGSKVSDVKKK